MIGRTLLAATLLSVLPAVLAGQGTQASPLLPPEHWAVAAADRAEALGLAPGWFPAQRAAPAAQVARAFREAVATAEERGDSALVRTAEAWSRRLAEEMRGLGDGEEAPEGPRVLGLGARLSAWDEQGLVAPGSGLYGFREGPRERGDTRSVTVGGRAALAWGGRLAASAEPSFDGEAKLPRWEVSASAGPMALSVGRQAVGYGTGAGGGVVLSSAALGRVELRTERPVRLPGLLRVLGPTTFHTFVSRTDEPRHAGRPWLWGARGALRPHPRLTVAVSRASIFGGDSVTTPTNAANVGKMLLGLLSADFENQVVAMDFRWRLPTERALPLTAYLEWGAEDAAGGWWDVPGRVVGLSTPAVPGLPWLSAAVEAASFPEPCCGNPPWYLHGTHAGGWATDAGPLGHPLGGEGTELLARVAADLPVPGVRVEARGFRRDRSDASFNTPLVAGNLYAPDRAGVSWGGAVDAAWRFGRGAEARAAWRGDAGDGWREAVLRAGVSIFF